MMAWENLGAWAIDEAWYIQEGESRHALSLRASQRVVRKISTDEYQKTKQKAAIRKRIETHREIMLAIISALQEGTNKKTDIVKLVNERIGTGKNKIRSVLKEFTGEKVDDAKFLLWLSATPYRNDGLTRLIYICLGDRVHRMDPDHLCNIGAVLRPEIVTVETNFQYDSVSLLWLKKQFFDRNKILLFPVSFDKISRRQYIRHDGTKLNLDYILSLRGDFFTTVSRSIRVMFQI